MKTHSGVIFTIIASTRWPGFSQPSSIPLSSNSSAKLFSSPASSIF